MSQTYVDGFDYPIGDRGYDTLGYEYPIPEQINSAAYTVPGYTDIEINEMYPDWISATPNRGSSTTVGWHNDSDVGDWYTGGIHPGEDWNYGAAGDDIGKPEYLVANGVPWDIRPLSGDVTISGWCIVFLHVMPLTGDSLYSFYMHTTCAANTDGTICLNASDFGFVPGVELPRNTIVARVGNVTGFGSHLHFEIRTHYEKYPAPLWPNGPGGRYPEKSAEYQYGITMEKVAQAYYEMQLDGIIDPSDFIDANRPSTFTGVSCLATAEGDPFSPVWQKVVGTSGSDVLGSIVKTNDGGYIVGGSSSSEPELDKTSPTYGSDDYWIVKINSCGEVQWDKSYGGSGGETLDQIIKCNSGYMLLGSSSSDISGTKSENGFGSNDFWIVKIDENGTEEWQKTIGGTATDENMMGVQLSDGSYIVGGQSHSSLSGNKTDSGKGSLDFYFIKISEDGNMLWQKSYGGNSSDYPSSMTIDPYDKVVIAGTSQSGISGDKDEGLMGYSDAWIIQIDESGNIEWQNTIAGSGSDGARGVIKVGAYIYTAIRSNSNAGGDKSENSFGPFGGSLDNWIIKLDSVGEIVWDKTVGGNGNDTPVQIYQNVSGKLTVLSSSESGVSGNKTSAWFGDYDGWIYQIDSSGNLSSEQLNLGGTLSESPACLISADTISGDVIVGMYSNSSISGNKSVDNYDATYTTSDFWLVKVSPEACLLPTVSIGADGATVFCQGESVTLTATHDGTTVQWYRNGSPIPGATSDSYIATTKGTYTCEVTNDCGVTTSESIMVNVIKVTVSIVTFDPTTFCEGDTATLYASYSPGSTLQWYNGMTILPGETGDTYIATTSGYYRCKATKSGCSSFSNIIPISVTCKESVEDTDMHVFPNPADEYISIVYGNISGVMVVYDITGHATFVSHTDESGYTTLDVSTWTSGTYVLRFVYGDVDDKVVFVVE
ncbi:T9SS type A sorting domain-containing protein [Candidatus Nomurabacteria bacterium]|nr:T9SS type A sorting domain-containing protein [Candidatus Nomurabacteria bacterium]